MRTQQAAAATLRWQAAAARLPWPAAAAVLLGAACVTWAAVPVGGSALIGIVTVVAAVCLAAGTARLLLRPPASQYGYFSTAELIATLVRALPWAEGTVAAILVLESLHPSRPWHTGVLGAALLGYLLAVHLGEAQAPLVVLRPLVPLLAAGLGLLALAVGAALLRPVTGSVAALIAVLAMLAAVIAAGLAVSSRAH